MSVLVALFSRGAVTFGRPFMMVRSRGACFFGHRGIPIHAVIFRAFARFCCTTVPSGQVSAA
jgi:hypothetical protein